MFGFGDPDSAEIGVAFADGSKTMLDGHHLARLHDGDPDGPVLMIRGGGGGAGDWRMGTWLWPLPPAGPLTFVVAWPAHGVAETSVTVDAAELVDAAGHTQQLWEINPDERARGGYGYVGGGGYIVVGQMTASGQSTPPTTPPAAPDAPR